MCTKRKKIKTRFSVDWLSYDKEMQLNNRMLTKIYVNLYLLILAQRILIHAVVLQACHLYYKLVTWTA